MIEGTELFSQVQDAEGSYDSKAHIAEMIALLGPPPKKLLVISDFMAQVEWSPAITDERGKIFKNNREYFSGSFFDDQGKRAVRDETHMYPFLIQVFVWQVIFSMTT